MEEMIRRIGFGVDIVLCIDATLSMEPMLKKLKEHAQTLYQDIIDILERRFKKVYRFRIRLIVFRDYCYDQEKAMLVTGFLELPQQRKDFENCIYSIEALGGGDEPEDGLEALAYAMDSKWSFDTLKKRHLIVVLSDAGTHDLGFGKNVANYPKNMPSEFEELTKWWGSSAHPGRMDEHAKRLALFTPHEDGWKKITDEWRYVLHYTVEAGNGLRELKYEEMVEIIANMI